MFHRLSILCICVLIAACQTTAIGKGPVLYTKELQDEFMGYVAANSFKKYEHMLSVFVIDPNKVNRFSWFRSADKNKALRVALERCDGDCEVFAFNHRVVWEGFPEASEWNRLAAEIANRGVVEINKYNKDAFKLSYHQRSKFSAWDRDFGHAAMRAFAISVDGKQFGQIYFENTKNSAYDVQSAAVATCQAKSDAKCYLYAYNNEVYE